MSDVPPRRSTPPHDRNAAEHVAARARARRTPASSPAAALPLPELIAHLDATSTAAELGAVDADPAERASLALLAQTARALHALAWPLRDADPGALWEARRRATRMRSWLRARTSPGSPARAIALCEQTVRSLAAAWHAEQHATGIRPRDPQALETEFSDRHDGA